jgi:hypothetical protein
MKIGLAVDISIFGIQQRTKVKTKQVAMIKFSDLKSDVCHS